MGLLDIIRNLFSNNKTDTRIIVKKLIKNYGDPEQLEIALYTSNRTPLPDQDIYIQINRRVYKRKTDKDGIARLNINLERGEYDAFIDFMETETYNSSNGYCEIIVKDNTILKGNDITKTASETVNYTARLTDSKNNNITNEPIDITVNGITYSRKTNNNGEVNLPIRLGTGEYKINTNYQGNNIFNASHTSNTVKVVDDPEPEPPEPVELHDYITEQGSGRLGQICGWSCGPHSLMQCIYRLTGIELSESTLMSVCGTTTDGTGHFGLETGLAWFNREYGYNLKMEWFNFSEIGFDGLQEAYNNGAVFCQLLYRDQWGHYEVPLTSISDPMRILNSLGDSCGGGYCGYIESRSQSTQRRYIGGISQKSVCIITR